MLELSSLANAGDHVTVIAEAGVNHNGQEDLAFALVEVAAQSGADFVKFQTFDADKLVAADTPATPYQQSNGAGASQTELLSSLALDADVWPRLRQHAEDLGIGFLSSPFDLDSARLLIDLGVDALKVSSGELTNIPFLRQLASFGTPLLVSTGMGTEQEVLQAVAATAAAPAVALFHCVSSYPAPPEECNLRAIPALASKTGLPVGWSDHTVGLESAMVAAALGARLFEKHFTLDPTMEGPDHKASLDPAELARYVAAVRLVPTTLGDGVKRRMPAEEPNAPLVRRSWHATRQLAPGDVLSEDDVVALRPESGIPPNEGIVGRRVTRIIGQGAPIEPGAVEADA